MKSRHVLAAPAPSSVSLFYTIAVMIACTSFWIAPSRTALALRLSLAQTSSRPCRDPLLSLRRQTRCQSRTATPLAATTPSSPSSSSSSSSSSTAADSTSSGAEPPGSSPTAADARAAAARAKRRNRLIGLAKAVDRSGSGGTDGSGGPAAYRPGGADLRSFRAASGLPDRTRPFLVLGIESSCDDTGAAVLRSDGRILGEALASQAAIHQAWGGVVPGLARDAHVAAIDAVVARALREANLTSVAEVDAVAATVGPGLEICLRVGCEAAKALALQHRKPFVGVHHLEAHILMARLPTEVVATGTEAPAVAASAPGAAAPPLHRVPATTEAHESWRAMAFPFLALLVSGGHCQLLRCEAIGNYTILGGTLDDSLGEAFDKVARLLGLPIGGGGGPALEALARTGDPGRVPLSVPLQARKDCDFSYSGLKTNVMRAVHRLVEERGVGSALDLSAQDKADVAASFQNVAFKHVEQRLRRAMDLLEPEGIRQLAVVGGVAANTELRSRLGRLCRDREEPWTMYVPPPRLCTDQGAMSAWAAIERIAVGSTDDPATQQVFARYPFASPYTKQS